MKTIIQPDFYTSFQCIADKCSITCCQEWKIAVDSDTKNKWASLKLPDDCLPLSSYTQETDSECIITLHHQICPFLNPDKLCKLVLNFGDSVLSQTCTQFPREIHEFSDRIECSLVSCCPEIIDYLSTKKLTYPGLSAHEQLLLSQAELSEENLLFCIRQKMMLFLSSSAYDLSFSYQMIFYIALDIYHKYYTADNWDIFSEQYFSSLHTKELASAISQINTSWEYSLNEQNELFLDLVENYQKQGLYLRFLSSIIDQATLISELDDSDFSDIAVSRTQFQKQLESYHLLFENFLISELFTNALKPASTIESFTVMLQWIAIEYTTIIHCIFLKWLVDGKQEISYNTVRDSIVIVSRMTGYEEDDIFEYLENSFENLIWEWGYLALIMPKEDCP